MFIDKNDRRINPYAAIEHNGTMYHGNVLEFPDAVEALGIREIQEPVPPEDYSEDTYFRTEQDEAPYVVYERRSDEQMAEIKRLRTLGRIRSLEDAVENDVRKVTRLFMIELFQYIGAQNGITPDQLYQDNKGYRGLVDLEAEVAPLRKEL